MLFIPGLIVGGISFYASLKVAKVVSEKKKLATATPENSLAVEDSSIDLLNIKGEKTILAPQRSGDENFPVATASLGFIVVGSTLFAPLTVFGVAGLVYLILPTWKQGYRDITEKKRFTRMVLESLVLPVTLITGNFMAAALAYWFLYFALHIRSKAKGDTTKNIADVFVAPSSRIVYVIRDGAEVELTLSNVEVNDIIVVGAGEIIPVDGIITEGHASIDQHMLTGESQLVEKQHGDEVFAATLLLTGHLHIKVKQAGKETIASQSRQLLNDMTSFTDNLELRSVDAADRLALPLFLFGSTTSLIKGANSALAIFWAPLDDALYSAGPLGVLNYLNIALKRGILVKDGRALEALRDVDTVVFDKTGTLTNDIPQVVNIHVSADKDQTEVLRYAAAAEQKQIHPVALAILEAAAGKNIELPAAQSEAYKTGYGLTVSIGEQTVQVGSLRFMQQLSLAFPEVLEPSQQEAHELGYSLIYVAIDKVIIGAIELHASVRPDTVETINKLHELGHQVCIISGDHEKPTRHMANILGIDQYFAETLPEDKAKIIKAMQDEGRKVCYVGDGINDTIALKQADVSVSLSGASTIATDTAQVVLMNEELGQLIELIDLAKQLDKTYKKTIMSSAIPSVGVIGGVFLFHLTLSVTIIAYVAGMGLSMTYAMLPVAKEARLSKRKKNDQKKKLI